MGQIVDTTSGPVQGHAASNQTDVSEYLGIPYAQPPVGNLRFQPPVRYNGSATINRRVFVCSPVPRTEKIVLKASPGPVVFRFKHHGECHC